MSNIKGFVFDMDGVLTDTEHVWWAAYQDICNNSGITLTHKQQIAMMGMSTPEWSTYMSEHVGIRLTPPAIADAVETRVLELYEQHLPLIPGSVDAVKRLAGSFKIAIASSSTLKLIEQTARLIDIDDLLAAKVSSEEVKRGKPFPDVYAEAVHRLGLEPSQCAAIEDSSSGIRAAHAAGLATLGLPHSDFPATADALALCNKVLSSMDELTVDLVSSLHTHVGAS